MQIINGQEETETGMLGEYLNRSWDANGYQQKYESGDQPDGTESRNVLILALSTFNFRSPSGLTFSVSLKQDGNTEKEYPYYYQMEPVIIFLNDRGVRIDKVILLQTPETGQKKKLAYQFGQEESEKADLPEASEFDYAAALIRRWNPNAVIEPVTLDESNTSAAISESIDKLRAWSREEECNIYMDDHGAFRNVNMTLLSMLSLVEREKHISLGGIYTFNTTQKKLIEYPDTYELFDFVSGMNEFANYGRIDSLNKYYINRKRPELLEKIENISDGIQMCDVVMFEDGLMELADYLKHSGEKGDAGDEYLRLFTDNIKNDYSSILNKSTGEWVTKKEELQALNEIEWCCKKGFIQQAITLLEARMPIAYHAKGMLEYDEVILEKCRKKSNKKDKRGDKPANVAFEINNFIFNNLILNIVPKNKRLDILRTGKKGYKIQRRSIDDYFEREGLRFRISRFIDEGMEEVVLYHIALKEIRNRYNHARTDGISPVTFSEIKDGISRYIELMREAKGQIKLSVTEQKPNKKT